MDVPRDNADARPRRSVDSPVVGTVPERAPWKEIPSLRLVDPQLRQVADLIHQSLLSLNAERELAPLFGHLRVPCGKMLRPALVLLSGRCFGPLTDEHIRVSAILEMIHHATLLHDDVLDDGRMRRGVPTANCLWGNESAVLLGDFVLSQVFRMTADLDPATVEIIAQTAVRVCQGELRQAMQRGNRRLSEAQYLNIIMEKSAAFFGGCCRLGGRLAHAGPDQVEALARFGLHAGIAFQIADDLLDVAGDENETGKTVRSDFVGDKLTLAVIHLLRTVDASDRAAVCAMLASPEPSHRKLTDLLVQHGSLEYARTQAAGHVARAIEALENLPPSEARDALVETAQFMAHRAA